MYELWTSFKKILNVLQRTASLPDPSMSVSSRDHVVESLPVRMYLVALSTDGNDIVTEEPSGDDVYAIADVPIASMSSKQELSFNLRVS